TTTYSTSSKELTPDKIMIRRRRKVREIEFSFDSFLDVVANVVGIILRLILVAWVGARSYKAITPPTPPPALTQEEIAELPDPKDPLSPQIERERHELAELQARLLEQLKEWQKFRQDSTLTAEELARLTVHSQEVESERKKLEDKTQQDNQSVRVAALSLAEIRERSKRVMDELEALRKAPPSKQTLRYQTPVSHPFQSTELMFECHHGRISFIDLARFRDEMERTWNGPAGETLQITGQYSDTTAAVGAFRLRYLLELAKSGLKSQILISYDVEPILPNRGETVEKALAAGSDFRRIIDSIEPSDS